MTSSRHGKGAGGKLQRGVGYRPALPCTVVTKVFFRWLERLQTLYSFTPGGFQNQRRRTTSLFKGSVRPNLFTDFSDVIRRRENAKRLEEIKTLVADGAHPAMTHHLFSPAQLGTLWISTHPPDPAAAAALASLASPAGDSEDARGHLEEEL